MTNLKLRTLTASIMVAVFIMLLALLNTSYVEYVSLVFILITALAIWEISVIASKSTYQKISVFFFIILFLLPLIAYYLNNFVSEFYVPMYVVLTLVGSLLAFGGIYAGRNDLAIANNYFRFLYPGFLMLVSLLSLLHLIIAERRVDLIVWLVVVVAANDIGAYFIGKWKGRKKLNLAISPNKTINGMYGGLVLSLMLGTFGLCLIYPDNFLWLNLLFTLIVSVFAIFGDLLESYIKRIAGMKDSSNLLPGHGGILDRIDALIMASPVVLIFNSFII